MTEEKLFLVKQMEKYLDSREFKQLRQLLKDKEIVDLAESFSSLELSSCVALFRMVPRSRRAELFSYLELERQEELLGVLPEGTISAILNEIEPDDRTRLLEQLEGETRNRLLLKLDPEERQVAQQLLSYPDDSVGRLMTSDFLTLNASMSVADGLQYIHWSTTVPADSLHYLLVVDDSGILLGEVSLASLVVCDPPNSNITQIMKKISVALDPMDEEREAVEAFRKYDRNYIPVITNENKIIGIVTSDDVFDVAEEEATEAIQQFGGQGALEDSYFQTPYLTMLKKRAGWLAFLFIGGFFSCQTIKNYEVLLSEWGFLMFFLPIITSSGGNSGTQAASLIIRGLAINEFSMSDVWRVLKREVCIGLALGLILATIGFVRALTWGLGIPVGFIVFTTIIAVVLIGVICGAMLPFLFQKIKLDPAVVSSPFISTLLDVTGIMIYLNMALWVMSRFSS